MKKLFLSTILFIAIMPGMAQATLITIGTATYNGQDYNLIWDNDNNGNSVVWLDYSNAGTDWVNQVAWASSLNAAGVLIYNIDSAYSVDWGAGSWRLPASVDGPYSNGFDGTTTFGYNITSSEMGHLFYEELGNLGRYDTLGNLQSGWGLTNTADFENLIESYYWSGTEYASDTSSAHTFRPSDGPQQSALKINPLYGIAIRSGQVSTVPVSGSIWLFGIGLTGLMGLGRFRRRNRN